MGALKQGIPLFKQKKVEGEEGLWRGSKVLETHSFYLTPAESANSLSSQGKLSVCNRYHFTKTINHGRVCVVHSYLCRPGRNEETVPSETFRDCLALS